MDSAMETSMWKEEPLSPGFSGLESEEAADLWLYLEEDVAKQAQNAIPTKTEPLEELAHSEVSIWLPESPDVSHDYTSLVNRGQLASQILQSLDDEFIKEEPFSDWLEQKVDLPIFEELPSPTKEEARPFALLQPPAPPAPAPIQHFSAFTPAPPAPAAVLVPLTTLAALHQAPQTHTLSVPVVSLTPPVDTQSLLQEFECVFDKVEQSHGALTPPQSPPHGATSPPHTFHRLAPAAPPLHEDFSTDPLTPNPQAIAELDEIVRNRVAESWGDTSFRPPSPCTSSNSSFSENSPDTPATPESSYTDDPEWVPEPASPAAPAPGKSRSSRKRGGSKPYGGNTVEDKRLRKKEQNKNAATRYRMKKKAEVEEILGEEQELKDTNTQLKSKVADLSQEIRYLKNLMRDVCRAKGLIK